MVSESASHHAVIALIFSTWIRRTKSHAEAVEYSSSWGFYPNLYHRGYASGPKWGIPSLCTQTSSADMDTHTHTHPFNGHFSGTTQVSRYQKGKTNLDFIEARDSEWQWHQVEHMQVCTSLQTNNHASTSPFSFFTGRMPFLPPNQQRQSTEGIVSDTDNQTLIISKCPRLKLHHSPHYRSPCN